MPFMLSAALALVLTVLIVALPIGAVRLSGGGEPEPTGVPETLRAPLREADRHSRRTRSTAVLVAFAAALATLPVAKAAVPAVFGTVGLGVLLLGERRSPVVTTTRRTAALRPRRVRDHLPRQTALVAVVLVTVTAFFALGIPTASRVPGVPPWAVAQEQGTALPAGSFFRDTSTAPNGETITSVFYPWPGTHFLAPVLATTAVQLALAGLALRTITVREQVSTGGDADLDVGLRRRSAQGIVGFLLVSLSLVLPPFGYSMVEAATWEVTQWDYSRGTVGGLGVAVAIVCAAAGVRLLVRRSAVFVALRGPDGTAPAPGADRPRPSRPAVAGDATAVPTEGA